MTILAINIGNTNINLGMIENGEIKKYAVKITSEDFFTQFTNMIDDLPITRINTEVRISSVNPVYTNQIKTVMERSRFKSIHVIGHQDAWQVNFNHYQKRKLGIDRMLVCEAAYKRKELPAIVFDFGTATTMNVINKEGLFLGGAIFPGVYMGVEALSQKTAQLPEVNLGEAAPKLLGLSPSESMQSAALYGNVAMIEGMITQVEKELGERLSVYITGGGASVLHPLFTRKIKYEECFILEGILGLNK